MNNYSLFKNMDEKEINNLMSCLKVDERIYQKGDIILSFNEMSQIVGIMQKGVACLVSINKDGEKNIIDYYETDNIFGKQFSPNIGVNLYYILAKTECCVKFCKYENIITCCHRNCNKHIKLINNIILISNHKSQIHIDILSQRTVRNKLMRYFYYVKEQTGSTKIKIPLSLSDLADYLSVDRSSMMREIGKMNDDKIIASKGRNIELIQDYQPE